MPVGPRRDPEVAGEGHPQLFFVAEPASTRDFLDPVAALFESSPSRFDSQGFDHARRGTSSRFCVPPREVGGIVRNRRVTGFHLAEQYPDLVVQPIVEKFGGIWRDDEPVVVDGNLISSRHPDDVAHFSGAIRNWLLSRTNRQHTQR